MPNEGPEARLLETLKKAKAAFDMLHASTRGESCVTDEQLGNVLIDVGNEVEERIYEITGKQSPLPAYARKMH